MPDLTGPPPEEGSQALTPEQQVEALKEEAAALGKSPREMADSLLEEHLPSAILALVDMSRSSANERIRLDAAKYLTDRVLGRISDATGADTSTPLDDVIDRITSDVAAE